MESSKKVWFLSLPYLLAVVLGLALLLSHPKSLESLYLWQQPSEHLKDAVSISRAVWQAEPIGSLNPELRTMQQVNDEDLQQLETLRKLRVHTQNVAIGLLAFSLVMILLDRRISWGQLHRRGLLLFLLLSVTLGAAAWFHMDWLLKVFEKPLASLNPWTFDAQSYLNTLYPKSFWKTLGILHLLSIAGILVLPSFLGIAPPPEKAE